MGTLAPDVQREIAIVRAVLASKYPREALPAIASNYEITLAELKEILSRHGYDQGRAAMAEAVSRFETGGTTSAPTSRPRITNPTTSGPYVAALPVGRLFADSAYQRELDLLRVERMSAAFDIALVGIIEVSERDDGRFAILDGQHRWATVRDVSFNSSDENPHVVCRIHRDLTVTEEAALYHQLNTTRKQLTGWDRWLARRTAQEPLVLDIEACAQRVGLTIAMTEGQNVLRATKACENVVELGGIQLLENALTLIRTAYPDDQSGLDAAIIQGLAHVLHAYTREELDLERLVQSLATILPRQLTARADAVRELHKGTRDRLAAHVIVERYNTGKGGRVQPFFERVKPQTKAKLDAAGRRNLAIREWAIRAGVIESGQRVTKRVREAYERAREAGEAPDSEAGA